MSKAYVGDIGTIIQLDVGTNVTGATSITVECIKPSGIESHWPAVIGVNPNTIEHTILPGEFDEVGVYLIQAKLSLGSGTWRGETVKLTVFDKYK